MYTYYAKIINIVDGDTFDAIVDLGFNMSYKARFRLDGIDTPETWRPKNEKEKIHGEEATKFVKDLMLNKEVILKSDKPAGIFNRYGAKVMFPELDNKTLTELLIEHGFEKKDNY